MINRSIKIISFSLIVLLVSMTYGEKISLKVIVKNDSGSPVFDAKVTLQPDKTQKPVSGMTDNSGTAILQIERGMKVNIKAEAKGYTPKSMKNIVANPEAAPPSFVLVPVKEIKQGKTADTGNPKKGDTSLAALKKKLNTQGVFVKKSDSLRYDVYLINKNDKLILDTRLGLIWTPDLGKNGLTWVQTKIVIDELNKMKYGGFTDWRMPSKDELEGIYEGSKNNKVKTYDSSIPIDPVFNFNGNIVWSRDTMNDNTSRVWAFHYIGGGFIPLGRESITDKSRVLAVRP